LKQAGGQGTSVATSGQREVASGKFTPTTMDGRHAALDDVGVVPSVRRGTHGEDIPVGQNCTDASGVAHGWQPTAWTASSSMAAAASDEAAPPATAFAPPVSQGGRKRGYKCAKCRRKGRSCGPTCSAWPGHGQGDAAVPPIAEVTAEAVAPLQAARVGHSVVPIGIDNGSGAAEGMEVRPGRLELASTRVPHECPCPHADRPRP